MISLVRSAEKERCQKRDDISGKLWKSGSCDFPTREKKAVIFPKSFESTEKCAVCKYQLQRPFLTVTLYDKAKTKCLKEKGNSAICMMKMKTGFSKCGEKKNKYLPFGNFIYTLDLNTCLYTLCLQELLDHRNPWHKADVNARGSLSYPVSSALATFTHLRSSVTSRGLTEIPKCFHYAIRPIYIYQQMFVKTAVIWKLANWMHVQQGVNGLFFLNQPKAGLTLGEQPRLLPSPPPLHLWAPVLIQSKRWQRVMFRPHRQLLVRRNLLLRMSLSSAVKRGGQVKHGTARTGTRGSDWTEREERLLTLGQIICQ